MIRAADRVVCILTSSGLKDPGALRSELPPVPVVEPTIDGLRRAVGEQGAEVLGDDV